MVKILLYSVWQTIIYNHILLLICNMLLCNYARSVWTCLQIRKDQLDVSTVFSTVWVNIFTVNKVQFEYRCGMLSQTRWYKHSMFYFSWLTWCLKKSYLTLKLNTANVFSLIYHVLVNFLHCALNQDWLLFEFKKILWWNSKLHQVMKVLTEVY